MAEDPKTTTTAAPAAAAGSAATVPAGAAPETPGGPPTAAELLNVDIAAGQKVVRAKGAKNIVSGVVHVLATFNNTIVSVTDARGNVVGWSSAGKMGYKGSRKSTAYAAQLVSQDACRQAMGHGLREAVVEVKGPGAGRESAVRAVQAMGIEVLAIRDVTPIPHNGCRPPKARRV
ncbi:MAG: 30S ribosomal protein S11 [Verrucomicrobiales bacterium]